MASQPINVTLGKGVALLGFVKNYASVDVVPFTDQSTGEQYNRLVCKDQFGTIDFVNMSSKLTEVQGKSASEVKDYILASAEELQVVGTENGTHILCKKGGDFKDAVRLF